MKIGMNEILSGIECAAINKLKGELTREGFNVELGTDSNSVLFDLYAEKGDDKRIYEFKIGKNKIQGRQFTRLQEEAKRLNAKLYIIYLEVPRSNEIVFQDLEQIIYEDIVNDLPGELDCLSTHTFVECIDNVDIESMTISDKIAKVEGSGTAGLELQFGSNSDLRNDDGIIESRSVDFFFRLSIDLTNNKVIKNYYKFDRE